MTFKIFLLKVKKIGSDYHRYIVQPLILFIFRHSSKNTNVNQFFPLGRGENKHFLFTGREYCPHIHKIYALSYYCYNNCKWFKIQNNCFKMIRIRYNCTQFCPIQMCWRNRKFRTTAEILKRYAPKSNQHEIILRWN